MNWKIRNEKLRFKLKCCELKNGYVYLLKDVNGKICVKYIV